MNLLFNMKNNLIAVVLFSPFLFVKPAFSQYYHQAQYNPPTIVGNSNQPIIVPPTMIMPSEHNSSKKSCKESVIDLFLFSIRRTTGDCTP
jgi:hypothetical protein